MAALEAPLDFRPRRADNHCVTFLAVEPRKQAVPRAESLPRVRLVREPRLDICIGATASERVGSSPGASGVRERKAEAQWRQALAAADLVAERFRTAARTLGVGQR